MLLGELPDLRDTQSGKDLMRIGKEEGKTEGKQEDLLWTLEAKFGAIEPDIRQRVEQVKSAEKLKYLLLQVLKADSIEQFIW